MTRAAALASILGLAALWLWSRSAQARALLDENNNMLPLWNVSDSPYASAPNSSVVPGTVIDAYPLSDYGAPGDTFIATEYNPPMNPPIGSATASHVSDAFIAKMKVTEGFSAVPYPDPRGQTKTYSIGHGYQIRNGEPLTRVTPDEAHLLLLKVIGETEAAINNYVNVPLNQNQYDALAALVYNIGVTAFINSTLLAMLNQYDYSGAADQFTVWRKANGRVDPTLVSRRAVERELFLS